MYGLFVLAVYAILIGAGKIMADGWVAHHEIKYLGFVGIIILIGVAFTIGVMDRLVHKKK